MTQLDVNRLLNDFYEGKTTIEQEQDLLLYFKSDKVPEEMIDEQVMFLSCYEEDEIHVPIDLQSKLETIIDNQAEKDSNKFNRQEGILKITLNQETEPPKRMSIWMKNKWLRYSAIAACFIMVFTISFFSYKGNESKELTDTYKNPKDAYIETQRALTLVAQNLNAGFTQLEEAEINLGKAQKIVNKQLNKISKR
jgi:hypothetical protein